MDASPTAGKIIWLASYPKSGNTWLRILLTNYWRDGDEPADINRLTGGPIASARSVFDDYVGVEASDLTPAEIERLRPQAFSLLAAEAKEPLFLKVHDAFTYTDRGDPLFEKASTFGVIYLIRNPLDVAVSFAHHNDKKVSRMIRAMANPDYAFVSNPERLHNQLVQRLLTWSGHVTSWVDEPGLNVLVVRYEDTKADPIGSFTRVVRFCGLDDDPERIARAVRHSAFDVVQQQEETDGFGEKMPASKSFFRRGSAGSWREALSAEQADELIHDHEAVMRRFDYLDEAGRPRF